jgi:hypothetical protein
MKKTTEDLTMIKEALLQMLADSNYKVYTKVNHVTASGMSRSISAYVGTKTGEIIKIDWYIMQLMDEKIDNKHGGIKMGGCGMDMCFALVYNLSSFLFRNEDGSYSHNGAYKLSKSDL